MDTRDSGTIVLGWLARLTVTLGVLGLIAFDVISLAVTRLNVADDATAAAVAAAAAYNDRHNVDRAYETALSTVQSRHAGDTIAPATFHVARDGAVQLTVEREAVTIVARYIPSIKDQLVMRGEGTARP